MRAVSSLLLIAATAAAQTQDFGAHVTAAEGRVSIDRDRRPWAISSGETIPMQRIVTTGQDGFVRLEVDGGASFEIYADSRVGFRQNPGNTGDLLDVLSGRAQIHLNPGPGEPQNRIFCRTAIVTAHEPATFAVAIDEDGSVRLDVLEGEVAVQHALLPRSQATIVKAIDSIVVEPDEQISRRMERGTLYRYTIKPLHDLYEALTFGHSGVRVEEQPFTGELLASGN